MRHLNSIPQDIDVIFAFIGFLVMGTFSYILSSREVNAYNHALAELDGPAQDPAQAQPAGNLD